jgi:hypothetical protein
MTRRLLIILAAALIGAAVGGPALAQFDSIFGNSPPRPPADVPGAPPSRSQPPPRPLPAPMSLPPSQRPGGAIDTQPLAPPPGTRATTAPALRGSQPPAAQPPENRSNSAAVTPNSGAAPVRTLPGLPPGQRQPTGTPQTPGKDAAQPPSTETSVPTDEIVVTPPEQKIENPTAVFSGLDKITGRTISFVVAINETVQFGALQVTPHVCYSRPPTETPRTDAFVTVDEVTLQGEIRRIFNGWMFAASPGLNAVEHPIYDVWLTDCKGGTPAVANKADDEEDKAQAKPKPSRRPSTRAPSTAR